MCTQQSIVGLYASYEHQYVLSSWVPCVEGSPVYSVCTQQAKGYAQRQAITSIVYSVCTQQAIVGLYASPEHQYVLSSWVSSVEGSPVYSVCTQKVKGKSRYANRQAITCTVCVLSKLFWFPICRGRAVSSRQAIEANDKWASHGPQS